MTHPAIAEIARGLTIGQRLVIVDAHYLDPRAYGVEGWEVSGRSANSLSLKGLAKGREIRSLAGRSRRGIALTDIGLLVRAHLAAEGAGG
jgi:hypothetical protein